MTTYLLTWDGNEESLPSETLSLVASVTQRGEPFSGSWTVSRRSLHLSRGDRLFLLRQRSERGLIASGWAAGQNPDEGAISSWQNLRPNAQVVSVIWDGMVAPRDRLPTEELQQLAPQANWDGVARSGVALDIYTANAVNDAWRRHLETLTPGWTPRLIMGAEYAAFARERFGDVLALADVVFTEVGNVLGADAAISPTLYNGDDAQSDLIFEIPGSIANDDDFERLLLIQTRVDERVQQLGQHRTSRELGVRGCRVSIVLAGDGEPPSESPFA